MQWFLYSEESPQKSPLPLRERIKVRGEDINIGMTPSPLLSPPFGGEGES
jgi:hypothetical protein